MFILKLIFSFLGSSIASAQDSMPYIQSNFSTPPSQFSKVTLNVSEEKLLNLLKHDCGSCHGMSLKGGLGPPLYDLSHRNWKEIASIIEHGRSGTAMPPWKIILSQEEIHWLAQYLTKIQPVKN